MPAFTIPWVNYIEMYYNRKGEPLSREVFNNLFNNINYQVLEQTTIVSGKYKGGMISTVWLGIDHAHKGHRGPPVIFESMVFDKDHNEVSCCRASTEKEVLEYHKGYCAIYNKPEPEKPSSRFENMEIE